MNQSAETATSYVFESGGENNSAAASALAGSELSNSDSRSYWAAANDFKREHQQSLPSLTIEGLVENSERVMNRIDLDKDKLISAQEMSIAVDNPYIIGNDAQVLAAIYRLGDTAASLHEGTFNPMQQIKTDRIKEDLRTLLDLGSNANSKEDGLFEVQMGVVDLNSDRIIDRGELVKARKNKPSVELTALTKFFYKEEQRAAREGRPFDGVTADRLEQFNRVVGISDIRAAGIATDAMARTSVVQRNAVSTEVFADKDNPLNSITPDAIQQGALGNCYLQAVVAGIAVQKPELIRDMIQDVGHGVYKVTFSGDKDNPVYVIKPSDVNIGIFNKGSEHGTWPNILEKAYGRYQQVQKGTIENTRGDAKGTDGGGRPEELIALLTGNESHDQKRSRELLEINKDNPKFIEGRIKDVVMALKNGDVVTAATGKVDASNDFGVPEYHALTVMGTRTHDGKTYFAIRDPWGPESKARNNTDGLFELEALEFLRAFEWVAYEKKKQ